MTTRNKARFGSGRGQWWPWLDVVTGGNRTMLSQVCEVDAGGRLDVDAALAS